MPGRTEPALYESGRATAPPVVRYSSDSSLSYPVRQPEGYTHTSTSSGSLAEQVASSPRYIPNYAPSPRYTPCPSPSYPTAIPKPTTASSPSLPSQSPQYTPTYSATSHLYSPSFAPSTSTYPSFNSHSTGYNPSAHSNSSKSSFDSSQQLFGSSDHLASTLFNIPPVKTKPSASPRYTPNYSNFSYFSNSQKHPQVSESYGEVGKSQKSKSPFEFANPKPKKTTKDDLDLGSYNIGDLQQFLSKHATKIKDSVQDSVTDSLLSFLQRKNLQPDCFPEEYIDNQVVVSVCNKLKADSDSKRKDLDKSEAELNEEERKCKGLDEKKKNRKEIVDDFDTEERKRDAMSHHYQEEKNHHKRGGSYNDFNQWDYLNSHDTQVGSNHGRRGHLPFSAQAHGMPWNPMGMVAHQTNPYYPNPHPHMMPVHAHANSDYRLNQWSNKPQSAHQGNSHVNQTKMAAHQDMNKAKQMNSQDFGLPLGTEFSKLRTSAHDLIQRTSPNDLGHRPGQEYAPSLSPAVRSTPAHQNNVSNPLSNLQMLVTNQDSEKPCEKTESYQQESVDLSAHSDLSRLKDMTDESKTLTPGALVTKDIDETLNKDVTEKPVELTAKSSKCKSTEREISSTQVDDVPAEEARESDPSETRVPVEANDIVTTKEDEMNRSEEKLKESVLKEQDSSPGVVAEANEKDGLDKEKTEESPPGDDTAPGDRSPRRPEVSESDSKADLKRKSTEVPEEPDSKKGLIEVECELEKLLNDVAPMSGEAECAPTVSSTSADVKPPSVGTSKKKPAKKRPPRVRSNRSSSSETQTSKKKTKTSSGKSRTSRDVGPVLHIEGSRECPTSVAVVNFPKNEDDDDRVAVQRSKPRPSEVEYRGRSRKGLFSSTLSTKYDDHSADQSWICVLCKKGPHQRCLGDLYGPYIVSQDMSQNHSLCDFSGDEKDISEAQKRGGRKKSIRSNNMVEHFQKMSKKLRRQQSSDVTGMRGMRVMSLPEDEPTQYEVWMHEQCVVWSSGVCLVGAKLHGLDEAIWPSIHTMCSKCGEMGASLGCVFRNCGNRSHYVCAVDSGWSLEQDTFISTCHVHRRRS